MKPRHDGEWVSVPRELLERAKAMLAASPATAALGTQEGERIAELEAKLSWYYDKIHVLLNLQAKKDEESVVQQVQLASHARTIEALRAALQPFADVASDPFFEKAEDREIFKTSQLRVHHLRDARRALKEHPNGGANRASGRC